MTQPDLHAGLRSVAYGSSHAKRERLYDSRMSAATLRILARNIESDAFSRKNLDFTSPLRLQFSDFSIEYLHQGNRRRLDNARKTFEDAMFGECLIEREYQSIPPMPEAYSGFGAIPNDAEDLLLLLRLFHPGDLAFVAVGVEKQGSSPARQYPHRVISNLVNASTRPFTLNQAETSQWENFAASLRSSESWNANWFQVARRSFLYGGGKEFNPNFESEVDRVVDYVTALEAALVPETDFVGRRLKRRALGLLKLVDEEARATKKLLTNIYSIRSTLVHGGSLKSQLSLVQDRASWWDFEQLVRDLLIAALRNVPAEEKTHQSYLAGVYDPDDAARAEDLVKNFNAIKDPVTKANLLTSLRGGIAA